jgi:hypothetical protein
VPSGLSNTLDFFDKRRKPLGVALSVCVAVVLLYLYNTLDFFEKQIFSSLGTDAAQRWVANLFSPAHDALMRLA